jgi:hypothetical protein
MDRALLGTESFRTSTGYVQGHQNLLQGVYTANRHQGSLLVWRGHPGFWQVVQYRVIWAFYWVLCGSVNRDYYQICSILYVHQHLLGMMRLRGPVNRVYNQVFTYIYVLYGHQAFLLKTEEKRISNLFSTLRGKYPLCTQKIQNICWGIQSKNTEIAYYSVYLPVPWCALQYCSYLYTRCVIYTYVSTVQYVSLRLKHVFLLDNW